MIYMYKCSNIKFPKKMPHVTSLKVSFSNVILPEEMPMLDFMFCSINNFRVIPHCKKLKGLFIDKVDKTDDYQHFLAFLEIIYVQSKLKKGDPKYIPMDVLREMRSKINI